MRLKIFIIFAFFYASYHLFGGTNPQAIAISDPLVTKIRQFGDTLWAIGRGISKIDLKTKDILKLHQQHMHLAGSELIFKDIYKYGNSFFLASNKGLWKLQDTTWELLTVNNSPLPNDSINCLALHPNGELWIGTEKGLIRKSGDDWISDNFGINFSVKSITFDKLSDTVFICSELHYFHMLVSGELIPKNFQLIPLMETRPVQYRKVIKDNYGVKWISTYGTYGLIRWNGDEDITQLLMNNTAESTIFDIEEDSEGNIHGINGEGYFKVDISYSNVSQSDYEITKGVLGRAVTVYNASDGNIWFGGTCPLSTRISQKKPAKYIRYNNALMPGPFLNTFHASRSGNTYLANYNGLGIFNLSTFEFFDSTSHGAIIKGISDISTNSKNEIFLISNNQLFQFTQDSFNNLLGDNFKSYSYYGSTFDNSDTLWLTSRRFIWKYFDSKVDSITIPGPADNYCFTDIIVDKNQTKWIKTLKGYYGYRGGIWADSIMPADIPVKIRTFEDLKMYIDYNGEIWLTSIEVLFKYDEGKWEMMTSGKDGVPEFASLLNKVPLISFNPEGKMYLNVDEKVYTKEGSLWKEPKDLNPIFAKTYKLFVDVNDNKWIYKTEVDSVAITMFREIGVFNSVYDNIPINDEQLTIYPNPASDYLIVGANGRSPLLENGVLPAILIFDIFGNEMHPPRPSGTPQEGNWEIDVSKLPSGIYFIKFGECQKPIKLIKL